MVGGISSSVLRDLDHKVSGMVNGHVFSQYLRSDEAAASARTQAVSASETTSRASNAAMPSWPEHENN